MCKCVRYSRFFLNRMLQTLRNHGNKKSITLNNEFTKDLSWLKKFLPLFNGTSYFEKQHIKDKVFLDASQIGVGAVYENEVYHFKCPQKFCNANIATLEMLNILVAVRVWHEKWKKKCIEIHCDNLTVVNVLNSGKTKDPDLASISRNIFMETSKNDIDIQVCHVPGKNNNIANLLSRWETTFNPHENLTKLLPGQISTTHR